MSSSTGGLKALLQRFKAVPKMLANLCETEQHLIVKITLQFDSRLGLKFENAFDEPRIIVAFVTPKLQAKWNIRYVRYQKIFDLI